jgi:hypothetical protein
MKKNSRILFYILLNILISAATTLTVLLIWQAVHPMPQSTAPLPDQTDLNTNNATSANEVAENSTTEFMQENIDVTIRTVVGAGNLEMEYVEITNQSEGAVDLTNWQLMNDQGDSFTFPALILNEDGAIEVHSKSGNNTVIELYWQADTPLWQSGETVTLLDAAGETQATYLIP